ncbi:hypothetical protein [Nonomuraea sp. NPDC049725]|uniref:NACHT domain-containing protein n=1 Tax=Nonomuraea sp. NPDC049725 TaxID=3154508 RepID=UPI003425414C
MDYRYEKLLDERFQMLCQSLLVQEYEGVQCFPVGMPDGGRDATASDRLGVNAVVFQIKFSRHPEELKDPVKWVTDAIDGERGKIERLVERGATKYILITNVRSTSHLDTGRIDRVQDHLNATISIPAQCWWREDLDRRLDNNYSLKLRYPTLLDGVDLLRLIWEATGVGEDRERRQSALSAYFADQFDEDAKIRFKQAELLPTPLFDLYIDVPMQPALMRRKSIDFSSEYFEAVQRILDTKIAQLQLDHAGNPVHVLGRAFQHSDARVRVGSSTYTLSVGAGDLLLDNEFMTKTPRVVLEGAPGQGKSTLSQYLAQIQRARLLDRGASLRSVPASHTSSPIMLPFKLELRDLAAWLRGIDPWTATGGDVTHEKPRTLEGALAAHVETFSGGVPFDVGDLLKVIKSSPVLLILDALDEVADLDDRRHVVDEVHSAVLRLEQQAHMLRVLVTSRPTAIAGSPTLPQDKFSQYTLAPIGDDIALKYAEKWALVRHLDAKDTRALRITLRQKLAAPHMAELAKNTMQLSILLSLIYLRGSSLPDKRTELYDTYIDVFFSRESEKNQFVRNNRDILLDIHLYLGFYLHAQAEGSKNTGRISTDHLQEVLLRYLKSEKQPTAIVNELLTGVLERIVALVSRVEGTYEFEVQPLREYFAARYLYNTAPYSPQGREKSGTKPDRFEALAPNPYWLNVTRFFAGCFSKGELLDLAERICDLIKSDRFKHSLYPRNLAVALLQDWVFAQSPRATKRLVEGIFDRRGLRWAAAVMGETLQSGAVSYRLSENAGMHELLEVVWPLILSESLTERRYALCRLLSIQDYGHQLIALWKSELDNYVGARRVEWIQVGGALGVLGDLSPAESLAVLNVGSSEGLEERLEAFLTSGGLVDTLPKNVVFMAIRSSLNTGSSSFGAPAYEGYLSAIPFYLHPTYWLIFGIKQGNIFRYVGTFEHWNKKPEELQSVPFAEVVYSIIEVLKSPPYPINRSLHTWNEVNRILRSAFGKTLLEVELAVMAASIRSTTERGQGADQLLSDKHPIASRVRNARRRGKKLSWWKQQLLGIADDIDRCLWILSLWAWASPEVVAGLVKELDENLMALPLSMRDAVFMAASRTEEYSSNARLEIANVALEDLSDATTALLLGRLPKAQKKIALARLLPSVSIPPVALACLRFAMNSSSEDDGLMLADEIDLVARCHATGVITSPYRVLGLFFSAAEKKDREWAEAVSDRVWDMPDEWVGRAYRQLSRRMPRAQGVLKIAERDSWFAQE